MVFDSDAVWVFMCVAAVRLMLVISYWFRQLLSLKVPPKSDEVIKLTVKKASQKKMQMYMHLFLESAASVLTLDLTWWWSRTIFFFNS